MRCVLRSANSPEPRRARVLLAITLLSAGAACSRGARAVRLLASSPSDEIYRITCEDSIALCRNEAEEVCARRYQVLESSGASIEPERVTSAPGPASTGPRYQRRKWLGQMVVACGHPATTATGAGSHAPPAAVPAVAPDRVCVPGATQVCLGPGACRGAQACSTDGNGYDPCDCGNASLQGRASAARSAPDGGATAVPSGP